MSLEPFKGLRPFYEEDAEYFCGRDEDVEAVMNMLLVYRLTILHGVAGVGKTSFLRAGVAHAMSEEAKWNQERWGFPGLGIVVFPRTENTNEWLNEPVRKLTDAIREQMRAVGVDAPPFQQDRSFRDFLNALAARLDNPHGIGRLFLILDQFEMSLHQDEADVEEDDFLGSFAEVINTPEVPVHILIALQSSDFGKHERLEGLIPRLWDSRYELEHLNKEEAMQAILGPIRRFNAQRPNHEAVALEEEESFVLRLLEDITAESHDRGGPSSAWKIEAPYLQLVMQRLWQKEGIPEQSHVLRLNTYKSLGGTKGIIQEYVYQCMDKLLQSQREAIARVLHVLPTPPQPARISELSELVAHANDDRKDWQPILLEDDVQHLFANHLVPNHILRPLAASKYEIFLSAMNMSLANWVERQLGLDALPPRWPRAWRS